MSSQTVSASSATPAAPLLRVRDLSQHSGQHLAPADALLDLHAGEARVLFGENGAGRCLSNTLLKISPLMMTLGMSSVLLGTLLIMLVGNGLNLMQVGAYAQTMALGAIL